MGEYFTTRELAERLGWEASEISEMCRAGLIRAEKRRGRWWIPREEGERLLELGPLDQRILAVEAAMSRSRLARIAGGRATKSDWFWFGVGFGRGRYAMSRLMVLSFYLAYLKLKRAILARRSSVKGESR